MLSRRQTKKKEDEKQQEAQKKQQFINMLKTIFDNWDNASIECILEAQQWDIQGSIDTILRIEETEAQTMNQECGNSCSSPKVATFNPKNKLPDDFLRVPGTKETLSTTPEKKTFVRSNSLTPSPSKLDPIQDQSLEGSNRRRATTTAAVTLPPTNISFLDTLNSEAVQRSRLDITGAALRLQDKSSHPVNRLAEASVLYQQGVINSNELDRLRDLLLKRQKLTTTGTATAAVEQEIECYEWGRLLLQCKNLRPGLSIQIKDAKKIGNQISHVQYFIQITDIESGVCWEITRRFKEFHKLYKKLCHLVPRTLNAIEFPVRQLGNLSNEEKAQLRLPVLQVFLKITATLVTPFPITFLRGHALREFENFVDVQAHMAQIKQALVQKEAQDFKVYIYQLFVDPSVSEGKACRRFVSKLNQANDFDSALMEELKDFCDNLQAYLMQHRQATLEQFVLRNNRISDSNELFPYAEVDMTIQISDAIRQVIELLLLEPYRKKIWDYLRREWHMDQSLLDKQVHRLHSKPQTFFDIPLDKISVSSWESVIACFRKIQHMTFPSQILDQVALTGNQIHRLYEQEQPTESATSLSGDDILPIFIYVVVQSNLPDALVLQKLLTLFCNPERRSGQTGYYLACFEAAISHILSLTDHNASH